MRRTAVFTLFSLKNPTTFDVNGLIFGISQTAAEYNFRKGLELLRSALSLCGQLPRQKFKGLADFESYAREHDCLKIDATEVAVQALQKLAGFVGLVQAVVRDADFGEHADVAGLGSLILFKGGEALCPALVSEVFFAGFFEFCGFLGEAHRSGKAEGEGK